MTLATKAEIEWEAAMAETFGHLQPGPYLGSPGPATGSVRSAPLGRACAFDLRGTPQVLRRTPTSIRRVPADPLKVCIQRAGRATLRQGDVEVTIGPGEMAVYDTGRPYDLRLDGRWRCAVLTLPRESLPLAWGRVTAAMSHSVRADQGSGQLLAHLIGSAVEGGSAGLYLGEAAVYLLTDALSESAEPADDDDGVRAAVRSWIQAHAADPGLTHDVVARAHHMSARTLHRVFAGADHSVAELIRETRLAGLRADLVDPIHPRRSIMAIASRWGFCDQAHLTRAFRAAYGTTPAAFRREASVQLLA